VLCKTDVRINKVMEGPSVGSRDALMLGLYATTGFGKSGFQSKGRKSYSWPIYQNLLQFRAACGIINVFRGRTARETRHENLYWFVMQGPNTPR
jgi:hypothetical protein